MSKRFFPQFRFPAHLLEVAFGGRPKSARRKRTLPEFRCDSGLEDAVDLPQTGLMTRVVGMGGIFF